MTRKRKKHDLWKGSIIEYVEIPEHQVRCRNCKNLVKMKRICARTGSAIGSKHDLPHSCKWFKQKKDDLAEKSLIDRRGMRRGAAVLHKQHGRGVVESVTDTKIYVEFEDGVKRGFSFPQSVDSGLLKLHKPKEERREQDPAKDNRSYRKMLSQGWKVRHKTYGTGYIVATRKKSVEVRFYDTDELRTFPLPDVVDSGILVVTAKRSYPNNQGKKRKPTPDNSSLEPRKKAEKKGRELVKGTKLRVKDGKLVCPICGFTANPGTNTSRCPHCRKKA